MTSALMRPEPVRLSPSKILKLQRLYTSPWTEYVGEFIGTTENDGKYHIAISINDRCYRITVPSNSKEREILELIEILDDQIFQKRRKQIHLGLLFTDDPDEPIKIRRII